MISPPLSLEQGFDHPPSLSLEQGFDLNRLLKSYSNFIYARQVATRLSDYFFSVQEIKPEASDPKKVVPEVSRKPCCNDENCGMTEKTEWPLPLIMDLKKALSAMEDRSGVDAPGPCPQPSPPAGPVACSTDGVEALTAFIGAIQQGGLLLGVAGPVGSGKTVLLHELIWQLWLSKGETIAYTAQKVWIPRGSLASRITFGADEEANKELQEDTTSSKASLGTSWLQQVVDATGLRSDIEGGWLGAC